MKNRRYAAAATAAKYSQKNRHNILYIYVVFFCSSCINNIILSEIYSRLAHFYSDFEWRQRWCIPFLRELFYTHENTTQNIHFFRSSVLCWPQILRITWKSYGKKRNEGIINEIKKKKRPSFQSQTSKSNFTNRFWCGGPSVRRLRLEFRWVHFSSFIRYCVFWRDACVWCLHEIQYLFWN